MELLILAVLEDGARHGYEIGKAVERRSGGQLDLGVSTLYCALYGMEDRGFIKGRWVEWAGKRHRCFSRLTSDGEGGLEARRLEWRAFAAVVEQIISPSPA